MERIELLQKNRPSILRGSTGQGLVEYALILMLVTLVVVLAVRTLGTSANSHYENVNSSLINAGK
jgi:pilus assembly protein Flp/PilA